VKEDGKNERQVKINYNVKRNNPTDIRYKEGKNREGKKTESKR
jgi:hypothetical protein